MFDLSQVHSSPINGMVLALGSLFCGAFIVLILVNYIHKLTRWHIFQSKDFLRVLGVGYLALWGYIMFFMGFVEIFI